MFYLDERTPMSGMRPRATLGTLEKSCHYWVLNHVVLNTLRMAYVTRNIKNSLLYILLYIQDVSSSYCSGLSFHAASRMRAICLYPPLGPQHDITSYSMNLHYRDYEWHGLTLVQNIVMNCILRETNRLITSLDVKLFCIMLFFSYRYWVLNGSDILFTFLFLFLVFL
jgi:hypothetical protein